MFPRRYGDLQVFRSASGASEASEVAPGSHVVQTWVAPPPGQGAIR